MQNKQLAEYLEIALKQRKRQIETLRTQLPDSAIDAMAAATAEIETIMLECKRHPTADVVIHDMLFAEVPAAIPPAPAANKTK